MQTRWEKQSEEFRGLLDEIYDLHQSKGSDYGQASGEDSDHYANVRASSEYGIAPWVGAYLRLSDKIQRIKSFIRNGSLKNESLGDSLLDICTYLIIYFA